MKKYEWRIETGEKKIGATPTTTYIIPKGSFQLLKRNGSVNVEGSVEKK